MRLLCLSVCVVDSTWGCSVNVKIVYRKQRGLWYNHNRGGTFLGCSALTFSTDSSAVLSWATTIMNLLYHLVSIATVHIPPSTPGWWWAPSFCISGLCFKAGPCHHDEREMDTFGSVDHRLLWQGISHWETQHGWMFSKAQRSVRATAIFKQGGGEGQRWH